MQRAITAILEETNVPAAGLVVVTPAESWIAGIGTADIAAGRRAEADTCFRLGSIAKSFVSLAALRLAEQGKLDLNAPVRELAPGIAFRNRWESTHPVRVAHLLEHTAGFDDIHPGEYAVDDPEITLERGLALNPASRTVRWRPGAFHSYSNAGPAVAAHVMEQVTGQRFEDMVREQLFDPLGMSGASFRLDDRVRPRLAIGYEGDGTTEAPYTHILMRPSGALNASPNDMANFLQFLLNRGVFRGQQILERASLERMETPGTSLASAAGVRAGYALGNYTTSHDGFLFHGHSGGIEGFLSSYAYVPEHGLGYFYSINATNGGAFTRVGRLLRAYLVRDLDGRRPVDKALDPARIEALTGYYEPTAPRQELTRFLDRLLGVRVVSPADGGVEVSGLFGAPAPLHAVTDRHFRGEDDPVASIVFLDDSEFGRTLHGWSTAVRGTFRPVSAALVWAQLAIAIGCVLAMASSIVFALVWLPRWYAGRLPEVKHLSVRVLPLVSSLSFLLCFLLVYLSSAAMVERFGKPTVWSWGIFVLGVVFAVTAVWGLVQSARAWQWELRRSVRMHSLLVSAAAATVAVYLGYYGIIGLRTWAY